MNFCYCKHKKESSLDSWISFEYVDINKSLVSFNTGILGRVEKVMHIVMLILLTLVLFNKSFLMLNVFVFGITVGMPE
jgi:hypothetical protein